MSTLRLPLIGDFVYVSRPATPDIEQKFTVTGEVDDGYHIVPEGKDPINNTSMIKYRFPSKKWVVHQAENEFNVRIQLNPTLHDGACTPDKSLIMEDLKERRFDRVKESLDVYRSESDLELLSTMDRDGDSPYSQMLQSRHRIDIFNWLQRNYIVNYIQLLWDAILEMLSDNPDEVSPDVLMWLLDQDIDWSKHYDDQDVYPVIASIYEEVLAEDRIDIFEWVARIPGLMETAEKEHGMSFSEGAEIEEATKILELLRAVPQKSVQVKHLQ